MRKPLTERFWEKVDIRGDDACWPWLASKAGNGYGYFRGGSEHDYQGLYAHRVVWELTYGGIPDCMHVCHHCDNPPCCNPKHLFLGTHAENQADMAKKGRSILGEKHHNARLSAKQVLEIRARWSTNHVTQRELATIFNVSRPTIAKIVNRYRWQHI